VPRRGLFIFQKVVDNLFSPMLQFISFDAGCFLQCNHADSAIKSILKSNSKLHDKGGALSIFSGETRFLYLTGKLFYAKNVAIKQEITYN